MFQASAFKNPTKIEALICHMDWQNFSQFLKQFDELEAFRKMHEYFSWSEKVITASGGIVANIYGDDVLAVFPRERVDLAIPALIGFAGEVNRWFKANRIDSKLKLNCHLDEIIIGTVSRAGIPTLDIFGKAIITCVTLGNKGVTISPQVFRSLSADNRKSFKKYTPPIVYKGI